MSIQKRVICTTHDFGSLAKGKGLGKPDPSCEQCRKTKADNKHLVVVHNPNGGQEKKVVEGFREAQRVEVDLRSVLQKGRVASTTSRQVTLREFTEQTSLPARDLAARTADSYETLLRKYIYPDLGNDRVRDLATSGLRLKALFKKWERDGGKATRFAAETLLRSIIKDALIEQLLDRDPLLGIKPPKRTLVHGRRFAPSFAQSQQIRKAIQTPLRGVTEAEIVQSVALHDVLVGTGVRIGELLGLAVDDFDRERGVLKIQRQLIWVQGKGLLFGPPKRNSEGEREIPLPQFVIAALSQQLLRNGSRTVTLPWERFDGKPHTATLIFHSLAPSGRQENRTGAVSPSVVGQRYNRIGKRLGFESNLSPHCFRHAYTSLLLEKGIAIPAVDEVTGHAAKGSTTLTVYGQALKEGLARVPVVLQAAWDEAKAEAAA